MSEQFVGATEENVPEKWKTLKQMISNSEYVVFFGGAGVSTESGVPDFRSVDGLYNQKYRFPPEEILSHTFFMRNKEEFFRFYRDKLLIDGVLPNDAHKALAKFENQGKLKAVITQNIDGLHQAAGSRNVYELHGSVQRNYCMKCGKFFDLEAVKEKDLVPKCECGGVIKPDVVLYEEGLNDKTVSEAIRHIMNADMLIIGGTSLTVYPAAGFIRYFRGKNLVLINKQKTPLDGECTLVINDKIGQVMAYCAEL